MRNPSFPEETLVINRFDSYCNACGGDANLSQKAHITLLGYGAEGRAGCGVKWKYVASSYIGLDMKERCLVLRPDLEWAGYDEESLERNNG